MRNNIFDMQGRRWQPERGQVGGPAGARRANPFDKLLSPYDKAVTGQMQRQGRDPQAIERQKLISAHKADPVAFAAQVQKMSPAQQVNVWRNITNNNPKPQPREDVFSRLARGGKDGSTIGRFKLEQDRLLSPTGSANTKEVGMFSRAERGMQNATNRLHEIMTKVPDAARWMKSYRPPE